MTYHLRGMGAITPILGPTSPSAPVSTPASVPSPTAPPRPTLAPLTNLTRPFDLVPAECERVGRKTYTAPPSAIPANKPLVMSFVRVRFNGSSPIERVLDQIVPKTLETTRGGAAAEPDLATRLREAILGRPSAGAGAIQIPSTVIGWVVRWTDIGNPTYIGAGWIPDTESDPTWTRGVLWVAVASDQSLAPMSLRRAMTDLVDRALKAANAGVNVDLVGTTPAMASSMSDDDVIEAAYDSAIGIAQFGAFIRTIATAGIVSSGIHTIANPINQAAQRVVEGLEVYRSLSTIESAIGAQINAALASQPPVAGIPILQNARAGVVAAKKKVEDALRDAPGVLRAASVADTQLKQLLQQSILTSVNRTLSSEVPFSLAREFVRCGTLRLAQQSLVHVEAQLAQSLSGSVPAAQQVVAEQPAIQGSLPVFDRMLTAIAHAEAELPKSALMRSFLGLPVWAWIAGGAVTVVGGAVTVRVLRKKKPAVKPTTANRRARA